MAHTLYSVEFMDWIPQKRNLFFLKKDGRGNLEVTNDPQGAALFSSLGDAQDALRRLRSPELLRFLSNKTLSEKAVLFHLALCPFVRRRFMPRLLA